MADLLPQLSGRRLHRSAASAAVHKRPAMLVSILRHHVVHIVQAVPRPLCWRVRGTGRCQPPWFFFGIHDTCQVCRALSRIIADVDVAGVLLTMAQRMPFHTHVWQQSTRHNTQLRRCVCLQTRRDATRCVTSPAAGRRGRSWCSGRRLSAEGRLRAAANDKPQQPAADFAVSHRAASALS